MCVCRLLCKRHTTPGTMPPCTNRSSSTIHVDCQHHRLVLEFTTNTTTTPLWINNGDDNNNNNNNTMNSFLDETASERTDMDPIEPVVVRSSTICSTESDAHDEWIIPLKQEDDDCARNLTSELSLEGRRNFKSRSTRNSTQSLSSLVRGDLSALCADDEEEEILPLKGKDKGMAAGPRDFQLIFSPNRSVVRKVMGAKGNKDGLSTSTNHSRRSSSTPSMPNLSSIHEKSLTFTDHSSRNLSSNVSSNVSAEVEWDDSIDSFAGHSPLSVDSGRYRSASASPMLAAVSSLLLSHQKAVLEADFKEVLSPRIHASPSTLRGPNCRWGDSSGSLPDGGSGPPRLPMHRCWED